MSTRTLLRLAMISVLLGACTTRIRTGFDDLRPGMDESEVRGLLGDPSVVVPGETGEDGAMISGPRWQYGDNLSTITTAAAFPRTVPDRVWVVWFDPAGRVVDWRRPIPGAQSSVEPATESHGATPVFVAPAPPRNR